MATNTKKVTVADLASSSTGVTKDFDVIYQRFQERGKMVSSSPVAVRAAAGPSLDGAIQSGQALIENAVSAVSAPQLSQYIESRPGDALAVRRSLASGSGELELQFVVTYTPKDTTETHTVVDRTGFIGIGRRTHLETRKVKGTPITKTVTVKVAPGTSVEETVQGVLDQYQKIETKPGKGMKSAKVTNVYGAEGTVSGLVADITKGYLEASSDEVLDSQRAGARSAAIRQSDQLIGISSQAIDGLVSAATPVALGEASRLAQAEYAAHMEREGYGALLRQYDAANAALGTASQSVSRATTRLGRLEQTKAAVDAANRAQAGAGTSILSKAKFSSYGDLETAVEKAKTSLQRAQVRYNDAFTTAYAIGQQVQAAEVKLGVSVDMRDAAAKSYADDIGSRTLYAAKRLTK